ncbi:MAG: response regulator [Gemmatimonadales bacterium]|nr:MAG: response regulator [Gemmatimonadales bacterium]
MAHLRPRHYLFAHLYRGAVPHPPLRPPPGLFPETVSLSQKHWLVRVAERAGIEPRTTPEVSPSTPVREAWDPVVRALGVRDRALVEAVANHFRLEVADLESGDEGARDLIPDEVSRKHHIFPLHLSERQLVVATCDPTDLDAERSLGFASGRTVVFQVSSPRQIREALEGRNQSERSMETLLTNLGVSMTGDDDVRVVEEKGPENLSKKDAESAPVTKLANLIIREGIEAGASDIHIEPGRERGQVRIRVDGVLRSHMELPMPAMNRLVSRVKILAKIDITDRLRPQDGKARVMIGSGGYDLRVSTIPAAGSEKCVIRILDSTRNITLEDLELPGPELARFRELLGYREGVVLVTGPTGSGKTTTLYGALRELADGKVNIMTVEDPVEYDLPAITQTQVETKQGVTFASALRAILRQDPDVILVGEIRDRETAETAAQAALTGHLVLATVHANDSVAAVARMVDLGLQHSTVATALRGTLAQRLLRQVCPDCAEPVRGERTPEEEELAGRYESDPIVRAVGCSDCGFTGYRGRLPVQEVMFIDSRVQEAIELRKGHATLQRLAIQGGMRTMKEVALDWVAEGRTTLVEVERVIGQVMDQVEDEQIKGPPRILVVDDDEEARLLLSTILRKEGYEVEAVEDGQEAMDVMGKDPDWSLVILDLSMPLKDGREVLRWIRGAVDTAAIPVLVRTGKEGAESEVELLNAGADGYLSKEVQPQRFLARTRALLRRSAL